MSANRSVQAAQRRRAGPQDGGMPGKGPQPSINSAQVFSNKMRTGQGPNIPNGRLAGQQVAMQKQQQETVDGISSVSKMTIPQAITLITLRLGAVETKIMKLENETPSMTFDGQENMSLIDKNVFESITTRLESLEKRSSTGTGTSSVSEVLLLKQQLELMKQTLIQTKGATTSIVKDNKELKTQIDSLNKELTETRELLTALQNVTMDNSQKIMEFTSENFQNMNEEINEEINQNGNLLEETVEILKEDINSTEIIETDLRQVIENVSLTDNMPII